MTCKNCPNCGKSLTTRDLVKPKAGTRMEAGNVVLLLMNHKECGGTLSLRRKVYVSVDERKVS